MQDEIISTVSEMTKQEIEAHVPCKWNWVEASIWTDCMLAALGNGVKGGKWYGLNDQIRWPNHFFASWGLFSLHAAFIVASQSRCGNN
mgnify:CR=1 FL=1